MTGLNLTHRRAQRFADLVEPSQGAAGTPDGAPDSLSAVDLELLALVGVLRAVPLPQPRAQFSSDLRDRLMHLARTELVPTGTATDAAAARRALPGADRRPRERRLAVALTTVAIVGASSSMAVAAQGALPGDALYPLKRVIEDAHAHLGVSNQAKGGTLLHSAADRLDEVRRMTAAGDPDPDRVDDGLDTFADQFRRGADLLMSDYRERGDASSIDTLRRFDVASMRSLSDLEGTVPVASEPALLAAAQRVFTVDAAAGQLCPDCSTSGVTEIPATLVAGASGPTAVQPGLPFGLGFVDVGNGDGGVAPHPTATYSVRPSGHASTRPTTAASPTVGPTFGPTAEPTTTPTSRPTSVDSASGDASDLPTSDPTLSDVPTDPPTLDLPTDLPSDDPVPTDVPTVVDTAISDLLSGLTDVLADVLGGGQDDGSGYQPVEQPGDQ